MKLWLKKIKIKELKLTRGQPSINSMSYVIQSYIFVDT